jgi:hypothetical protein
MMDNTHSSGRPHERTHAPMPGRRSVSEIIHSPNLRHTCSKFC